MINSFDIAGWLAIDAQSVDKLRLQARKHPDQALKAAAQQFEALFMNMLLKSMREATPKDGVFDSEQTRFYTSMLDQQLSQSLSTKGIGLADILIRQLSGSAVPNGRRSSDSAPAAGGLGLSDTMVRQLPRPTVPNGAGATGREPAARGLGLSDTMARQLPRPAVPNGQPSSAVPTGSAEDIAPAPQSDDFVPATSPEATREDDLFDSERLESLASMLDQELAQGLPAQGIGLTDIVVRQLTPSVVPDVRKPSTPAAATAVAYTTPVSQTGASVSLSPRDFVNRVWPHARAASQATGIPAHLVVAQAALESGWGKHEIRRADGKPSFNVFGIKAGGNWSGPVVEKITTEYVNGVPHKTMEKFRAYGSYAEGFRDYANLLINNPRYAAVLQQQDAGGFARGLQRAGYATDPIYAGKLMRIVNGNVLRESLALKA